MKKILIVGTGSIGERHTRCFLATGRAQVSICEPNDDLRKLNVDLVDGVLSKTGAYLLGPFYKYTVETTSTNFTAQAARRSGTGTSTYTRESGPVFEVKKSGGIVQTK